MPSYKELLVTELQHEVALTEKFLSRIPADKMSWKPHEKSMSVKVLANHLSDIPSWISGTMDVDELEMSGYKSPDYDNVGDIVGNLKKNAEAAAISLDKADEEYHKMWTMKNNGEVLMSMPKYQTLRGMVLNQLPHHRAQLGVYLRLMDQPVPATYGPSADEMS